MSGSVNSVMLVGRLGQDPEVRTSGDGVDFVHLSVATSESWKDRDTGQRKEITEWHRVVVPGGERDNRGAAEFAKKFLRKGALVAVQGKLRTRAYTSKDGVERSSTEILVDRNGSVNGLDSPKRSADAA